MTTRRDKANQLNLVPDHILNPPIREFDTGANRDTAAGKLEYIGFLCPIALERFAEYMHKNRTLRDGSQRASSNWKKGIPQEVYWQSLGRHFFEAWKNHDGHQADNIEDTLCAILFNAQGLLRETLLSKGANDAT